MAAQAVRGAWWLGGRIGAGINWGVGLATGGLSIGSLIYDMCSDEDEDECENADEECFAECEHLLGQGGRTNQGSPYRNCWISCMKGKGCYKGDMAVE